MRVEGMVRWKSIINGMEVKMRVFRGIVLKKTRTDDGKCVER